MKNYICTFNGNLPSYRDPTIEEERLYASVPKDLCKHELVHVETGFTTDEIVCSNCGRVILIFGS